MNQYEHHWDADSRGAVLRTMGHEAFESMEQDIPLGEWIVMAARALDAFGQDPHSAGIPSIDRKELLETPDAIRGDLVYLFTSRGHARTAARQLRGLPEENQALVFDVFMNDGELQEGLAEQPAGQLFLQLLVDGRGSSPSSGLDR